MKYTATERAVVIEKFLNDKCLPLLRSKGNDYTQGIKGESAGANANFYWVATLVGTTPIRVWFTYFAKHLSSLMRWITDGKTESEPLESRIADMVNYLLILYTLVEESKVVAPSAPVVVNDKHLDQTCLIPCELCNEPICDGRRVEYDANR